MLYFAYGSNLWRDQMRARCPDATLVGMGCLLGFRWIITQRGYASIVASPGDVVYGCVYDISLTDEESLDRYEGVAEGRYYKEKVLVDVAGSQECCMTYIDNTVMHGLPADEYVTRINAGLHDTELPAEYVAQVIRPFIPA